MIRRMGRYSADGQFEYQHLPPIDIIAVGEAAEHDARVAITQLISEVKADPGSFVWLGLVSATQPELSLVTELFGLEPLDVEDAANVAQRAKFDLSLGEGFALLKTLSYDADSREVTTGQTSVFVGKWFAITVRYGVAGDLTNVRKRMSHDERLRAHGPLAVLYAVMDITVDSYLAVAEDVHEDMRVIEQDVFSMQPTALTTKNIYQLKRENIAVSQAASPLVNAAQKFANDTDDSIPEQLEPFFADIGDHILRVNDIVESTDNALLTMLMASTALQDLKQNTDMRKISAWVAIAAVPTLTAGIFGMNFENMPELKTDYGYPIVLAFMAITCALLFRGFKKSGWL
jgi:magnesium transporter